MEWVVLLFVIVIFFIVLTKRVSGLAAQACSACADQGTSYRYKNSSDCSTLGCRCEQEACPVGSVRSSTDDKTCVPTSCPVGQTLSGNACVPCPSGTYKNNTGTGACTPCTNSSTGRYVSAACTSTTDTQFAPFTTCSGGQYLSGSSSGSSSTLGSAGTCTNCTTIVPTGQYTKSVCSGTSDTQFAPFTTCSSGTWLLEAKAGSSTILGNPGRCTTDCTQTSIGTNPNSRPISGQCQVVQSALPTCPTDFAYINFNYALYGKPAQNKCINRWCSLTPL